MPGHDIVVIGGSAGGIEALRTILSVLPADIKASLFVVVHTTPYGKGYLDKVLSRNTSLKVKSAEDNEDIKPGYVYVASPDRHLMIKDNRMMVVRGPRENRWRPAVDPLFRTAAAEFDSRVIGIVLSGNLDDGSAGLNAVKRAGGISVVQNPEDALFPEMPKNAINNTDVDYNLSAADIGAILPDLINQKADADFVIPEDISTEAKLEEKIMTQGIKKNDKLGELTTFSCPDCGGSLWEIRENNMRRYRCYLGHSYTEKYLFEKQDEMLERALYSAMRIMEERMRMFSRLSRESSDTGNKMMSNSYEERRKELEDNAYAIRKLLLTNGVQKES